MIGLFNPWVLLTLGALFLASNGYSVYRGYQWADDLCDSAKWKSMYEKKQQELDVQVIATKSAASERAAMKMRNDELESVVTDYESRLERKPEIVMACRDPAAARSLRAIK